MRCFHRKWLPRVACQPLMYSPLRRTAGEQALIRSSIRNNQKYRHVSFDSISDVLLPPVVFGGLLVTLWTYKCLMMIIFQNKIIYMPSVPPFSRSEKVSDYQAQCKPILWSEHNLNASDGTALKILEGRAPKQPGQNFGKRIVILYFQGNASSLPPRLPYLSAVLKALSSNEENAGNVEFSLVALSYRGFWTSKGRASQSGIELDADAALRWVCSRYESVGTRIIIWGQSVGAGVASTGLANLLRTKSVEFKRISGLLLETPFVNISSMLIAFYPQKFLPYRYLSPFLRSTWDSKSALKLIGESKPDLKVLLLQAGKDEVVPDGQASILEQVAQAEGMNVQRIVIPHALHTEVMVKGQGRANIVHFIKSIADQTDR